MLRSERKAQQANEHPRWRGLHETIERIFYFSTFLTPSVVAPNTCVVLMLFYGHVTS